MQDNKNRDIKITSLILMGLMAISYYMDTLVPAFVHPWGYTFFTFNLLIGQILLVTNLLTFLLLQLNKPEKERWKKPSISEMITLLKMSFITIIFLGFGAGGAMFTLPALFVYECSTLAKKNSWLERYLDSANQKKWAITRFLKRCVLLPFMLLTGSALIGFISVVVPLILTLLFLPLYNPVVLILGIELPMYLGIFLTYYLGAKMMGYNFRDLFTLPTDKTREKRMFSNSYRNFKWALIAFLITAPTMLFPLFASGLFACLAELYAVLSNVHYLSYILSTMLLFTVQPFFEEVFSRSLFYRYAATENLCPKDYQDMSHTHKITYSILNGFLFAIMHTMVLGSLSLPGYLYHMSIGIGLSMLAFLSGNVDMAGYIHSFHNTACALSDSFIILWFELGLPSMFEIGAFIANPLRYYLITSMESDYIRAEDKAEASRQAQLKDRAKRKPAWAVIPVSEHPETVIPMPASSAA